MQIKEEFIKFAERKLDQLKSADIISTDLGNTIPITFKQYSKLAHFIFEFVQNAEDAPSSELRFILDKDKIVIINNGKLFDLSDAKAISGVNSTKRDKRTIGYWGIGFKSVFLLSDHVQIFSDGFAFEFNKQKFLNTVKNVNEDLFSLSPFWVDNMPNEIEKNLGNGETVFIVHLKNATTRDDIKVNLEHFIDSPTILFLKNLNKISVVDKVEGKSKSIAKKIINHTTKNYNKFVVEKSTNGTNFQTASWIVIKKELIPSNSFREDEEATKQKGFFIENKVPISLEAAFKLKNEREFEKIEGRIFSYLPTEENTIFNFHINSDFVLSSSREKLAEHSPWNKWILSNISSLFSEVLKYFKNDNNLKYSFYDIIPIPKDQVAKEGWVKAIINNESQKIIKEINNSETILDFDEKFQIPKNIYSVKSDNTMLYKLFDKNEIKANLDKPLIHKKILDSEGFRDLVKNKFIDISEFSKEELLVLLKNEKILQKRIEDINWFKLLYLFIFKEPFALSKYEIENIKLFLDDKHGIYTNDNIYIKPTGEMLIRDFKGINFLHDELKQYVEENDIKIPIEELTEISLIKDKILPQFSSPEGKEKQLIDYIKLIFNVWKNLPKDKYGNTQLDDALGSLKFKTTKGWYNLHDCYLSEKFLPKELGKIGKLFSQLDLPIIVDEYLLDQEGFYDFLIKFGAKYRIFLTDETIFKAALNSLKKEKDIELFHLFFNALLVSANNFDNSIDQEDRYLTGGYVNKYIKSKMSNNIGLLQNNAWVSINGKWSSPQNVFILNKKIIDFKDDLPIVKIEELTEYGKRLLEKIGFRFSLTLENLKHLFQHYSTINNEEGKRRVCAKAAAMYFNREIDKEELNEFGVNHKELELVLVENIVGVPVSSEITEIKDWDDVQSKEVSEDQGIFIRPKRKIRIITTRQEIEEGIPEDIDPILSPELTRELMTEHKTKSFDVSQPTLPTKKEKGDEAERFIKDNFWMHEKNPLNKNKDLILKKSGIGHDFIAEDKNKNVVYYLEVKHSEELTRNITKTQFQKAEEYKNKYYLVIVKPLATKVLVYLVQNPSKNLTPIFYELDYNKINRPLEIDMTTKTLN